jgi:CheY-like chemotaxis protein
MSLAAVTHPQLLVVEDDPAVLALVQDALEIEGCAITSASDLPTSLELLSDQLFHLVLTDLFRTRHQEPLQSIAPLLTQATPTPVGIFTAWDVPAQAARQVGAAFLLRKPFDLDDLVCAVQQELALRPSQARQQVLVEQFFAALGEGDWPRVARLCTPDLLVVPLGTPLLEAEQGPRGLLAARPLLERRFHTLPGYTIEQVVVFARPLGVAARYTARWQSRDGVTQVMTGALRFRFERGHNAQIEGAF